jgi:hypothetical protein
MNSRPTPGDEVIGSRDVIEAIEELEEEIRDAYADARPDGGDQDVIYIDKSAWVEQDVADAWAEEHLNDTWRELRALRSLRDEADESPDWKYGEALICGDYFVTYAQELAYDIGVVSGEESWPLDCIDWTLAAKKLQVDYFSVDFGGYTYLIRS